MQDYVTLKVKVRSFPSKGRARVHESVLPEIAVKEGDSISLMKYPQVSDDKTKPVSVTAYGDKQVGKGVIMLSPEDIAALGVAEGDTIAVKRKVPLTEKITKKTAPTGTAVKEDAVKAGSAVKTGAVKAGSAVKTGAVKAGQAVEKGAKDVSKKVKPPKEEKK
jgi:formylmethanofuran dehydrogenase subunit D